MTEEEAKTWLATHGWMEGRAGERLEWLAALLSEENERQNLVAASTLPVLWSRHIVDSAQLLALTEARGDKGGLWADLGSGGGFPGLVIACLREAPVLLVETRKLRVAYLERCAETLGLAHCRVEAARVEAVTLPEPAAFISARAFAPLDKTLAVAEHLADISTCWLLPKGRNAQIELASARKQWQASFHVEQSLTDPDSAIIVADHVRRTGPARPRQNARSARR